MSDQPITPSPISAAMDEGSGMGEAPAKPETVTSSTENPLKAPSVPPMPEMRKVKGSPALPPKFKLLNVVGPPHWFHPYPG